MDFELTPTQLELQRSVRAAMREFDLGYWMERDERHEFPEEFFQAAARLGWLGVAMPEEYGGSGLGIFEAALLLQEVAESGAALSGCSAIHMNIFGVNSVVRHGSEAQRAEYLPQVVRGRMKVAFGVTEPDAGLDTTRIRTRAERIPGGWRIHGHKIWISTAQEADRILLLARTTPVEAVERKTDGMTLFFPSLRRDQVRIREIHKAGRAAVDSNEVWFEGLEVTDDEVVGEVGRGFHHLLDSLNPERILVAAEAVGIGRAALGIAARYASERHVFGRPIGMNQGVQFPLARCHIELELADLMVRKAAWLYDNGQPCGAEANMAKYAAAESGFGAADQAMQTLGGMGYAREFHVERLWRESKLCRLAPVSPELILAFIAERSLNLPRSY